jgi:SH3 domain-containing YSC84-like protein 1
LTAEIVSYSRARGAFAGIDISGGILSADKDSNTDAYGPDVDPKNIVFGNLPVPAEANSLLEELKRPDAERRQGEELNW